MTKIVLTPRGPIDIDTFYRERDSRMALDGFAPGQACSVAIAISEEAVVTLEGQRLLFWLCSMLRRSGRAFSRTILLIPSDSRLPLKRDFWAALREELIKADPFGTVEPRPLNGGSLSDVSLVVWIGERMDFGEVPCEEVMVRTSGWMAEICVGREAIARAGKDVRGTATAAAVAFAAALAVGEVHRAVLGQSSSLLEDSGRLWVSLDSGRVITDVDEGESSFARGGTCEQILPWEGDLSEVGLQIRNLLLVSAGGLGLNFARILAESFVSLDLAMVVDPDSVDLSNLNRLVGVGVAELDQPKAELAVAVLSSISAQTSVARLTYEKWSASGLQSEFLSAFDAVVVGVDQAVTRLEVAADWPALLVNGSTGGRNWSASVHRPGLNGCLGCFYGSGRQSYNQLHHVAACAGAGGVADTPATLPPDASYPHVSIAAAATMVAMLIHAAWEGRHGKPGARAGERRQMQMTVPQYGATKLQQRVETCRLLCDSEYVRPTLDARAITLAAELGGPSRLVGR